MIVNFRTRGISRGTHKLSQTSMLIKKIPGVVNNPILPKTTVFSLHLVSLNPLEDTSNLSALFVSLCCEHLHP
jgi:hypothetical protein